MKWNQYTVLNNWARNKKLPFIGKHLHTSQFVCITTQLSIWYRFLNSCSFNSFTILNKLQKRQQQQSTVHLTEATCLLTSFSLIFFLISHDNIGNARCIKVSLAHIAACCCSVQQLNTATNKNEKKVLFFQQQLEFLLGYFVLLVDHQFLTKERSTCIIWLVSSTERRKKIEKIFVLSALRRISISS